MLTILTKTTRPLYVSKFQVCKVLNSHRTKNVSNAFLNVQTQKRRVRGSDQLRAEVSIKLLYISMLQLIFKFLSLTAKV